MDWKDVGNFLKPDKLKLKIFLAEFLVIIVLAIIWWFTLDVNETRGQTDFVTGTVNLFSEKILFVLLIPASFIPYFVALPYPSSIVALIFAIALTPVFWFLLASVLANFSQRKSVSTNKPN